MVIKRQGKLFVVFKGRDELFKSYDFEECVTWVENKGQFHEARKKIKERLNRVG